MRIGEVMTMAEYIEREAALREAESRIMWGATATEVYESIRDVPAADVAPVRHGKWRYYHNQNIAVCTECSFERNLDANFGRAVSCPNCGADMRGSNDE